MNNNEQRVHDWLTSKGCQVLPRGWPDLLVLRDGRVCAIEVKAGADKLRPDQTTCHKWLRSAGIPVHVIRPENAAGELTDDSFEIPDEAEKVIRSLYSKRANAIKKMRKTQSTIDVLHEQYRNIRDKIIESQVKRNRTAATLPKACNRDFIEFWKAVG